MFNWFLTKAYDISNRKAFSQTMLAQLVHYMDLHMEKRTIVKKNTFHMLHYIQKCMKDLDGKYKTINLPEENMGEE